jgi:hypothetical protein
LAKDINKTQEEKQTEEAKIQQDIDKADKELLDVERQLSEVRKEEEQKTLQ